jgi:hypothetical protein
MSPLCCLYYSIIIDIYWWCRCRRSCLANYVTSSFPPIAINSGIAIIKLAEVLLLQTHFDGRGKPISTPLQLHNNQIGLMENGYHRRAGEEDDIIFLPQPCPQLSWINKREEHMMCIRGGSMMMKQQSTYARLQNTYWTIYKYGRLLLYQLYGMRRQKFD